MQRRRVGGTSKGEAIRLAHSFGRFGTRNPQLGRAATSAVTALASEMCEIQKYVCVFVKRYIQTPAAAHGEAV